jgi:TRAP-type C4-dicarboxylate transport system permease small subunit
MIIIEIMLKFLRGLKNSNIVEVIVGLQVAVLSVVVLLQVFFRYVLNFPLAWSEELSRFLLVWVVLLGAAIGIKRKSHFSIDIVFKKFPQKVQKNLQFAIDVFLFILIFDVMVLNGVYLANLTFRQISPALHLRMSYVYSAVLAGGILSCCYTLENILLFIKSNLKKI